MKIQKFNGGLATRLAPQFLDVSQSQVNINIDNSVGTLAPVRDKVVTDNNLSKYFKYFRSEDTFVSSSEPSDFLEYQGFMYICDRVGRPTKTRNGVTRFLGIERPESAPTLSKLGSVSSLTSISFNSTEDVTFEGGPTLIGDLPPTTLNYMLFVEKDGALSAGYSVDVEHTSTNVRPVFRGKYADIRERPEFSVSNYTSRSKVITITDINIGANERLVVYRYYNNQWLLVGSAISGSIIYDFNYDLSSTELVVDTITPFNGTYQYVYTYYNSEDGTESAPSDLSEELEVESGFIEVSLPSTSTDPQVDKKRVYRVGNNISVFSLVAEVEYDVTTLNDTFSDTDIDGRTLTSENYFEAPEGLKYLTESYAMLFGAVGSTLRFTPIGEPNAWPPEYSLQFDDDITGIGAVSTGVLVMTINRVHIVTGTGPFSLSSQPLRGDQGCISHDSIQQVEQGAVVWASSDGLCVSSGNNPQNITKYQLGDIYFSPTSSSVNNEVYYLHNNDGIIFVWDYRFEPVFKQLNLGVEYIQEANGKMLGYSDGFVYELLSSDYLLPYEYKSPLFVEGMFTEVKTYNKFFVHHSGTVLFSIFIDDELVLTKQLTGKGLKEMKIPQNEQKGYYVHFEVSGTGTVNEIEYEVGRRKNG